jgi:hypothetical protein
MYEMTSKISNNDLISRNTKPIPYIITNKYPQISKLTEEQMFEMEVVAQCASF